MSPSFSSTPVVIFVAGTTPFLFSVTHFDPGFG